MSVTMLALARFTLKGPYQAATVVGLLAVLAVFIPLMMPGSFPGVSQAFHVLAAKQHWPLTLLLA